MGNDKEGSNYDEAYNLEMERLHREEAKKAAREDFRQLKRFKKQTEKALREAEEELREEERKAEEEANADPLSDAFAGCSRKLSGFKFLGAPIGGRDFCQAHIAKRADEATALPDALRTFDHAQRSFQVIKHCAS